LRQLLRELPLGFWGNLFEALTCASGIAKNRPGLAEKFSNSPLIPKNPHCRNVEAYWSMWLLVGCRRFCLFRLVESGQNARLRAEFVVTTEGHVVDHRFEVAV
jgi:hypothetical protein